MNQRATWIKNPFQGSTQIWVICMVLAVFSFLPVYSASSIGSHFMHLALGLLIMLAVHRMPYRLIGQLSKLLLFFSIGLLAFTMIKGQTMGGTNASRWIYLFGFSFQPSALANVSLLIFLASRLAKHNGDWSFKTLFKRFYWAIIVVCALVLPANLSTTVLIFFNALVLMTLGGFPLKESAKMVGIALVVFVLFLLAAKAFPDAFPNRVDTWVSRIETFGGGDDGGNYQKNMAQTAIAEGGITGMGPGRGLHKHFLPQKDSDFIYALIVEEFGMIGGGIVVMMYVWFMLASVRVATRAKDAFGRLVVMGLSFSIAFQAMVNMAVAVGLFPVTGQTLPLVSAGGSSIWMTCLAVGVILAVSRGHGEGLTADEDMDEAMANDLDALEAFGNHD